MVSTFGTKTGGRALATVWTWEECGSEVVWRCGDWRPDIFLACHKSTQHNPSTLHLHTNHTPSALHPHLVHRCRQDTVPREIHIPEPQGDEQCSHVGPAGQSAMTRLWSGMTRAGAY